MKSYELPIDAIYGNYPENRHTCRTCLEVCTLNTVRECSECSPKLHEMLKLPEMEEIDKSLEVTNKVAKASGKFCLHCKEPILINHTVKAMENRKYCGKVCANKNRIKIGMSEYLKETPFKEKDCVVCKGKIYFDLKGKYLREIKVYVTEIKTCSSKCASKLKGKSKKDNYITDHPFEEKKCLGCTKIMPLNLEASSYTQIKEYTEKRKYCNSVCQQVVIKRELDEKLKNFKLKDCISCGNQIPLTKITGSALWKYTREKKYCSTSCASTHRFERKRNAIINRV